MEISLNQFFDFPYIFNEEIEVFPLKQPGWGEWANIPLPLLRYQILTNVLNYLALFPQNKESFLIEYSLTPPPSLQFGQNEIMADSESTPSKTSMEVISDDENVCSQDFPS